MAEQQKQTIQFTPITDGLGFHPFSDGMPYAPTQPSPNQGLKAPSLPQTKLNPALRTSIQNAPLKPSDHIPNRPSFQMPSSVAGENVTKHSDLTAQIRLAKPQIALAPEFGLQYMVARLAAYVLDTVFHFTTGLLALALAFKFLNIPLSSVKVILKSVPVLVALGSFFIFYHWALTTLQEVAFRTTLFKRLFGLGFRCSGTTLFLRALYFIPSFGFFGLGILWALFDSDRKCWHDIMVDAQPLK